MLEMLGSPTILVRTGCGKTAKSWSALSGIGQSRAIGLIGSGRLVRGEISRGKRNRAGSAGRTVAEERVRVAGTGVSSGTGQSGDWGCAGGMFTND